MPTMADLDFGDVSQPAVYQVNQLILDEYVDAILITQVDFSLLRLDLDDMTLRQGLQANVPGTVIFFGPTMFEFQARHLNLRPQT